MAGGLLNRHKSGLSLVFSCFVGFSQSRMLPRSRPPDVHFKKKEEMFFMLCCPHFWQVVFKTGKNMFICWFLVAHLDGPVKDAFKVASS